MIFVFYLRCLMAKRLGHVREPRGIPLLVILIIALLLIVVAVLILVVALFITACGIVEIALVLLIVDATFHQVAHIIEHIIEITHIGCAMLLLQLVEPYHLKQARDGIFAGHVLVIQDCPQQLAVGMRLGMRDVPMQSGVILADRMNLTEESVNGRVHIDVHLVPISNT